MAVAEGFEPSIAGLTIRCLTNLATPQELNLAAATRVELVSSRLQDERSISQLSYAAKFGGLEGIQTLARSLQDFYAVVTSPARNLVAVGGVEPPTSRL